MLASRLLVCPAVFARTCACMRARCSGGRHCSAFSTRSMNCERCSLLLAGAPSRLLRASCPHLLLLLSLWLWRLQATEQLRDVRGTAAAELAAANQRFEAELAELQQEAADAAEATQAAKK